MTDFIDPAAQITDEAGAQAEATRYFAERGARAVPGRAKVILARAGTTNRPREDDRVEDEGAGA